MVAGKVLGEDVPYPDNVGREQVKAFRADFGIGRIFTVDWQVMQIAASGDVIRNERGDIFRHEDGGEISLPVIDRSPSRME
ncbi:hypothetical protein AWB76_02389 [Caballeronia temeraria]|uniref:Uncharacterized protein n=1 Tax=Caballeronia temeraria TaxID=1777137 RepID=A0A158AH76_9BURK|nr:hypothetical protein [Caballeronia temeraria]SAK57016.1 hypothetical protein AWB76_02389 [Caballeronia temeraria]